MPSSRDSSQVSTNKSHPSDVKHGRRPSGLGLLAAGLVSAIVIGSVVQFLSDGHSPDSFGDKGSLNSWQWWLHPLPERDIARAPWPVGVNSRFVPRSDHGASHDIRLLPGRGEAGLGPQGFRGLADIHLFADGGGWALTTTSELYVRTGDETWHAHEVRASVRVAAGPPLRRIRGTELYTLDSVARYRWAQFAPRYGMLVLVGEDGVIQGRGRDDGRILWQVDAPRRESVSRPDISGVAPRIMIPALDRVVVLDLPSGKTVTELRSGKGGPFRAAAFAPDGRVVTWSEYLGLAVWDEETGKMLGTFSGPREQVNRIVFGAGGGLMATVSPVGDIVVYHYPSREAIGGPPESGANFSNVAFTSRGDAMVAVGHGGVSVFEVNEKAGIGRELVRQPDMDVLAIDTRNDTLIVRLPKTGVALWDYGRGTEPTLLDALADLPPVTAAAIAPAGDVFAFAAIDGKVFFLARSGRRIPLEQPITVLPDWELTFAADGQQLLTISQDGLARVHDATSYTPAPVAPPEPVAVDNPVRALYFLDSKRGWLALADGRLLITDNGGESWRSLPAEMAGAGGQAQQTAATDISRPRLNGIYFHDDSLGWIVGDRGFLARTEDGGTRWTISDTPTDQDLHAVHFANRNLGLAVGRTGTLLGSDDGGKSWKIRMIGTDRDLRSVLLVPGNSGWVAGATSAERAPFLAATLDGGESWRELDYSEMPAPLLLLVAFPLLAAIGFIIVARRRAPPVVEEGVAPAGSTDKPIGWDDPDPLRFQPIAAGISNFLRNADTESPLTIGINGAWGTGKSSLMNLVQEDLRKYDCRPVWFNAWHHQKEEHLLAALLENIRQQAVPRLWHKDGLVFRIRLLLKRSRNGIKTVGVLVLFLIAMLGVYEMLVPGDAIGRAGEYLASLMAPNPEESSETGKPAVGSDTTQDGASQKVEPAPALPGWQSIIENPVGAAYRVVESFGPYGVTLFVVFWLMLRLRALPSDPAKLIASLSRRASVSELREQLGFRHKFATEFKQVCEALRTKRSPGLVILIDDLDRCQPGNVLEVLEAVNFLTTVGDCFVIIGMARRQVENCIAIGFKDFIVEGMALDEQRILPIGSNGASNRAKNASKRKATRGATMPAVDNGKDRADGQQVHATGNQRRFARRYLEKLINIEVAVPHGDLAESEGLLIPPKSGNGMGQRLRSRRMMHTSLGVAQLAIVGALVGLLLSAKGPEWVPAATSATKEADATARQVEPTSSGSALGASETGRPATSASTDELNRPLQRDDSGAVSTAAIPGPAPRLAYSSLDSELPLGNRAWWIWWGPTILGAVVLVMVVVRRQLKGSDTSVEDSAAFKKAVAQWYPLIYAANPTPRAIKRFENRMRFLAMQAHPPAYSADVYDRLIDWIAGLGSVDWFRSDERGTRTDAPKPAAVDQVNGSASQAISDDVLVALGTIEAVDEQALKVAGTEELRVLVADSLKELEARIGTADPASEDPYRRRLDELEKLARSPGAWHVTARDISVFRELSGRVHA